MAVKIDKHLIIRLAILALTILAFIFCIAATAGSYWGVFSDKDGNTLQHVGLWRECTRLLLALDFNCGTIAIGDVNTIFQNDGTAKFNTTRAFMLLSCIIYGISTLFFVMIFFKKWTLKPLCALLFILTLFQLVAMAIYADLDTDSEIFKQVQIDHKYGWSYDLGWTAFAFTLIATIICFAGIYLQYVDNLKSGDTTLTAKQQFILFISEMKKAKEDKVLAITFAVLFLTIFSFVFCITATSGTYWGVYTDENDKIRQHVGLWRECTNLLGINDKTECGTIAIGDINSVFQTDGTAKFNTTRGFMVLSCIFYVVTFVLLAMVLLKKLSLLPICIVVFIITFFELVAMAVYRNLDTKITPLLSNIRHDYGWSYDLGWTAFVFSLITAFLCLLGIFLDKKTSKNDDKKANPGEKSSSDEKTKSDDAKL